MILNENLMLVYSKWNAFEHTSNEQTTHILFDGFDAIWIYAHTLAI